MKTTILLFAMLIPFLGFTQDSLKVNNPHNQIFSLSPISKKVDKVNGLVIGVGHVENRNTTKQTINGINLEANPAPVVGAFLAFILIPYLPIIYENIKEESNLKKQSGTDLVIQNWNYNPDLKINGLNISSGCFFTTTNMNGLNISSANKFKNFSGLTICPLGTIADNLNGLSVGLINANNNLKGISIGIYNQSHDLYGLQIGLFNISKKNKGLQIGVVNKSSSNGFQFGIWNKNNRRSFPLINW